MIYKGYKVHLDCDDWEQAAVLSRYWNAITTHIDTEKIVGLGMNWTEDGLQFDYALGTIEEQKVLNDLKNIDFSNDGFEPEYVEIELPDLKKWNIFKGKLGELREIYDKLIDSQGRTYDYELEYIDKAENLEIKIHFIN